MRGLHAARRLCLVQGQGICKPRYFDTCTHQSCWLTIVILQCVPGSDILSTGVRLYNGFGCAYLDASLEAKTVVQAQGGFSAGTDCVCSAAKTTCTGECQQYKDCSTCLQDQYCGWCSNETKCMLGSHSSPLFEKCSGVLAWKTGPPGDCNEDVSLWVIGLVCACTSSLLVGGMCCYFMVRVRIAAREAQAANAQSIRFGAGAVPAGGAEQAPGENAHDLVQRFLVTFPTFKFSEERVRNVSPWHVHVSDDFRAVFGRSIDTKRFAAVCTFMSDDRLSRAGP